MKNFKLFFPLFLLAIVTLVFACGDGAAKGDAAKTEQATDQGPEYTSAYICPMYCKGSGSDKAGTCPVCKMDYIANKNAKKKGTETHGAHDGHDHGDHDGHDHGSHDGHNH